MIQAVGKSLAKILSAWTDGTSRMFIATLVDVMSWKVALSLALTLFLSLTQGIQLLLLVPLMQLIGLDVQQGSIGWLSKLVSSVFSVVGIRPSLITVLGALVFFTTGLSLITRWQKIFNLRLEQEFVASLRRRLYRAIANTEWLLFSKTRSSELTHALTIELSRAGSAIGVLLTLVTNAILVSVYVLLALQLSLAMTTVVFVSGAGLLLVQRKKTRAARWTGEELSLASNGLYSAAIEHLAGMKTTKSYGAEERSASIFSDLAERVSRMFVESTRVYAGTTFWFNTGSVVILSIILYVSIEFLNMASASLILLLFLFNRMIPLFNALQNSYQYYVNAMPAFAGVVAFLDRFEATAETKTTESTEVELHRAIDLQNTSFSYGAEEKAPAIRDLNLIVEAGKTTAIVGPSGAGKSTIADLVMGLIVPTRGEIRVDGVLLRTALMQSWRARIGYVAQDTFLFNDTVRANLLWARPGAREEEIWEALELAAAKAFVSELPEGLETVLGDRGVRLSGGERQRLALARALLRRPSLLILDEATSALDSENERRIRSAIEDLHGTVTMLIITHRLTTVRAADVIYVLERGRLVERGDWEQLMRNEDGRFRTLAEAQGVG